MIAKAFRMMSRLLAFFCTATVFLVVVLPNIIAEDYEHGTRNTRRRIEAWCVVTTCSVLALFLIFLAYLTQ